jgi:hypothetical protein
MLITREIVGQSDFLCWILAIFGQLFKERKDKDFFGCSPLLLIRPGASQVQFFFFWFWQWTNLIGPSFKKWNYGRLPKIEGFILKYNVHPLGPTYRGERMKTSAKANAIKVRGYGENIGQHIGKLGNILRT